MLTYFLYSILDVIVFPTFWITFGGAIVAGFILAKRTGNKSISHKVVACLIPVIDVIIEAILSLMARSSSSIGVYVSLSVAMYILRLVAVIFMLHLFAKYYPAKWVYVFLVILIIIFIGYLYYMYQAMNFFMGALNGKASLTTVLNAFFNNRNAIMVTSYACAYLPIILIVTDAFTTVKKKD